MKLHDKYNNIKILYTFTKPHSPLTTIFIDKNDFIYIITYKTKSKEITEEEIIIRKDLDVFINREKRIGFIQI